MTVKRRFRCLLIDYQRTIQRNANQKMQQKKCSNGRLQLCFLPCRCCLLWRCCPLLPVLACLHGLHLACCLLAAASGKFSYGRLHVFDIPLLPASALYQLKELMVQDDVTQIQYDY